MPNFQYDPIQGLYDTNIFPSQPPTEQSARGQFMTLFNQIPEYLNGVSIPHTDKVNNFTEEQKIKNNNVLHEGNIAKSFDVNSYVKFPFGLQICWGVVNLSHATGDAWTRVTLPQAFADTNYTVNLIPRLDNTQNGLFAGGTYNISNASDQLKSTTQFSLYTHRNNATTLTFDYIAIGKGVI